MKTIRDEISNKWANFWNNRYAVRLSFELTQFRRLDNSLMRGYYEVRNQVVRRL